ncbi:MAG TPA: lipid kinase [Halieaceae bacterium]|jgi:NitT/TauT family transport system substrate-binding protein|uniref:putative urea ABC transporter substrate-binding protein n=1 Tax=Haliea sp. TaxID=1932666 RepID=UPI000C5C0914|nr:putative urea ABC transporter substrate-binding protein [Haliea sp.]HBQ39625.1 lipid kinase [Halieaceae bacterium]MAD64273.1 lipid kinase [Haliea sp.]MAY93312.1 lipid kinase [Haliea sp.]MBK39903.1 lipid kinase [Haliea sp.]MBP71202.1 lipid kinase [Haliea sp.]|tara:strand:+ start:8324 stop:9364 length:1041 start_codon:yes stop_codon:yes gene_type:complete
MKRISLFLLLLLLSTTASARDSFKICWSIYVGWVPWAYGADQGIVDKWADKYDIDIEVVQINDYIESINQYSMGEFDACTMTNMDALTIPAAGGVDSTALIVGDFSNGNDGIVLKGKDSLADIKGQTVNLVELSVSHYLLARGLESVGLTERDVEVVNTSDADMVAVYATPGVTAVATWNPLLSEVASMPGSHRVFDSSQIPGEVIDLLIINTETLAANPALGKALTGAWYEIMAHMNGGDERATAAKTFLAELSGTDLAGFESQLASTEMFYTPAEALALTNSEQVKETMQTVAEFSHKHGLLGEGAPDATFIGVETPAGVYGDSNNIKLRFDPTYMQMALDGEL